MDRTETCSGLSTRAFAICSMSSFIALQTQLELCFMERIFSRHLFPSETLLRPATDSIHTGSSLQKGRRFARAEELAREEPGREFLVDTGHGRFGGGGCGFSFISRIVTRNSGI